MFDTVPYLESSTPLIPIIAEYELPNQNYGDLPCDIYLPALPPVGTAVAIRDSEGVDYPFTVTSIKLDIIAPAKCYYTVTFKARDFL